MEKHLHVAASRLAQVAHESLWLWRLSGDDQWLQQALQVAAWFGRNQPSVDRADLAATHALGALIMAIDWVPVSRWPVGELQRALAAAQKLHNDLTLHVVTGPRGLRVKLESHRTEILPSLAVASLVLAVRAPAQQAACTEVLDHFLSQPWPWGGDDGGFANGTAYGTWDVLSFIQPWDHFRRATGVDPVQTAPGVRAFGDFAAYFMRPSEPGSKYGDAAERDITEARARMIRAYAARRGDPALVAFASTFHGADESRLELLTAPIIKANAVATPPVLQPVRVFESVGMASLRDGAHPDQGLVAYLRGSPYGAQSHAHADQNGVLLYVDGQPWLLPSGVYDQYGSPHHLGWTRRTVAHNTLTYDGGKGQTQDDARGGNAQATGQVRGHGHQGGVGWVWADATAAYGGLLTRYWRWVLRLDNDTVAIVDDVKALQPHRWELNFHTAAAGRLSSDGRSVVSHLAGAGACMNSLSRQGGVRWDLQPDVAPPAPRWADKLAWPLPRHQRVLSVKPVRQLTHVALLTRGSCSSAWQVTFTEQGLTLQGKSARANIDIARGQVAISGR
ncbi:heparinase II/III-family protein [Aquabacterium sp. A3]|uniref:heparinase II/III family protein n=1 Tax=Aquabacterium sp. A3 TaxID=3132829 RepID=UPI0031195EA4